MQFFERAIPRINQQQHVRHIILCKLLTLVSFSILILTGYVLPDSYANAADEKSIPREKKSSSTPKIHKTSSIREELELVAGYAEDVFELAKAERWKRASKKLVGLEKILQNLTDNTRTIGADNIAALSKSSSDLERAVRAKNRQDAMIAANKITAIAALMAKPYNQRVPINVPLLDYYTRELEIFSEIKNSYKASVIIGKMHLTWQNLMPLLIAEGGSKEVKKFGETMKRLEAAKTPEEYGRLANSIHDEVDNLEKVFSQKSSRSE